MMKAGNHDYSGSCAPNSNGIGKWSGQMTFSLGIFQWIAKSRGAGLRKSAVKVRVIGYVSNAEGVKKVAEKIVAELDAGTYKGKKSVRVGTV